MTQKTAIDTLIDDLLTGKITEVLSNKERYKEIERQQITKAVAHGVCVEAGEIERDYRMSAGEQYYEQTFGDSTSSQTQTE